MTLEDKINADIKSAMLAREKDKLEALRAIKSAVLLAKTEKLGAELSEDTELKLLQKLVKQRRESAEIYNAQNREDMANAELFQAGIIEQYLPQQLSPEEIKTVLQKIISDTGANSAIDMGKVMGLASKELAGKADGKTISALVKELLS
ncbi:MAG: GatB/YqeY domain-containing protein [Bacteroidia bacterium]|nr:GatB/YqeY domain-containing protein [Bacteroidia bacterium]